MDKPSAIHIIMKREQRVISMAKKKNVYIVEREFLGKYEMKDLIGRIIVQCIKSEEVKVLNRTISYSLIK